MFDAQPNALAFAALLLWPLASWALFARLGPARGLIGSLVAAYLLLPPPPAGFDLPLLPPLDKAAIPSLAALVACLALYRPGWSLIPAHPLARALLALFVLSPVATVVTNPEPVVWGVVGLPGLRLREAVGVGMQQALLVTPLLLARLYVVTEDDHRAVLWALLLGGLAYSLPMLLEVRLSPQLNIWVYGYFQHLFSQMIRGDGYRPIVFLYHGLWAAFFAMTAVLAACALMREAAGNRAVRLGLAALWMAATLLLCKSLASILYAAAFAPVILLASARWQLRAALLLAGLALAYPVARGAHLIPDGPILAAASGIDPERAYSLQFRFDNERALLERAEEKPLFGWGMWARNQIHDPETGQITSITDGRWIIVLGIFGWAGLLAEMGLLALPVALAWWRSGGRRAPGDPGVPRAVAAVALILGVNMADLIPNATLTPLTMALAGGLMGWAERQRRRRPVASPVFRTVL